MKMAPMNTRSVSVKLKWTTYYLRIGIERFWCPIVSSNKRWFVCIAKKANQSVVSLWKNISVRTGSICSDKWDSFFVLEINVAPLVIQMTRRFSQMLMAFLFPSKAQTQSDLQQTNNPRLPKSTLKHPTVVAHKRRTRSAEVRNIFIFSWNTHEQGTNVASERKSRSIDSDFYLSNRAWYVDSVVGCRARFDGYILSSLYLLELAFENALPSLVFITD